MSDDDGRTGQQKHNLKTSNKTNERKENSDWPPLNEEENEKEEVRGHLTFQFSRAYILDERRN